VRGDLKLNVNKKMLKPSTRILAIGFVVFSFFLVTTSAQALTIIPPSFEFGVTAGQTIETEIKMYNETQESVELFTEVTNFKAAGESGNPTYDFDAVPFGLATWFDINAGPVTLAPAERLVVPIIVNVPIDADPGGHYAAVFFGNTPPNDDGSQVAIGSKIGTLFLVSVAGDVVEHGGVQSLLINEGKSSVSRLPVTVSTRFANQGNVHVRPTGTITIKNIFGGTSEVLNFNEAEGATLPGTVRRYDATWEKSTVNDTGGFWTEFGNEWRNFAFGRYTTTAELVYGSNKTPVTASISFWVLPWRVISLIVILLIIVILLVIIFLKRYNAWVIKRAQNQQSE
jgi:hypothetical protein